MNQNHVFFMNCISDLVRSWVAFRENLFDISDQPSRVVIFDDHGLETLFEGGQNLVLDVQAVLDWG